MLRDVLASIPSKKLFQIPLKSDDKKSLRKSPENAQKEKTQGQAKGTPDFQQTENMNIRTCKLQCTLARKPLSSSLY